MRFKEHCNAVRSDISDVDAIVVGLQRGPIADAASDSDIGEARANLQLAHRHLEDARMRIGKALQAFDGGVSCYDKKP